MLVHAVKKKTDFIFCNYEKLRDKYSISFYKSHGILINALYSSETSENNVFSKLEVGFIKLIFIHLLKLSETFSRDRLQGITQFSLHRKLIFWTLPDQN